MSLFALCPLNLGDSQVGVVTAGSQASTSLAATNLQTRQLTAIWRSKADPVVAGGTWWPNRSLYWAGIGGVISESIGIVALLSHNTLPDGPGIANTQNWRVRIQKANLVDLKSMCHMAPATLAASTNLAGTVAAVQDSPYDPDSTYLTATVPTSNTQARLTFPAAATGTLPLKIGASLQAFAVLLRKSGAAGTNPTVAIDLYESGVLKSTLISGLAITSTTPVLISLAWNASLLSGLSTTGTEIRITGTAGTSNTVEIGAVMWLAEHNGYDYDSGVLHPSYPAWYAGSPAIRTNLVHVLPSAVAMSTTLGVTNSVLIDQSFSGTTFSESGRLWMGPILTPAARSMDQGWSLAHQDGTIMGDPTLGGQEWPEVRELRRTFDATLRYLSQSEAYADIFDKTERRLGLTGDLIVIPDTTDTAMFANQMIYGHLSELSPVTHQGWFNGAHKYQRRIAVREYL